MFLGLSMWSFEKDAFSGKMDFRDFIIYCAKQGYAAVELLDCFWKQSGDEIDEAKKIAQDHGIKIGCYAIANNFAQNEQAKRQAQVDYIKKGIETAAALGAPVLRVFGGSPQKELSYEAALPWIVEGFCSCKYLAEKMDVKMAMENHGTLSGSWKQVLEIISRVNSTHFGATADLGNFLLVNETPLDSVEGILPFIKHVHCKDFIPTPEGETRFYTALSGEKFSGCVLGNGIVGIDKILPLLRENNFDAMISIEYEGTAPASQGVPQSKTFVEKYL